MSRGTNKHEFNQPDSIITEEVQMRRRWTHQLRTIRDHTEEAELTPVENDKLAAVAGRLGRGNNLTPKQNEWLHQMYEVHGRVKKL